MCTLTTISKKRFQSPLGNTNYIISSNVQNSNLHIKDSNKKVLQYRKLGVSTPPTFFFFFEKTRAQFFISSFLAFEVLLDDILCLRFFAIVLNYHTTSTNHFTGFSLSVNFREPYPFP